MGFGVYIHFPYCRKRCPYCDFAIHVRRSIPDEAYLAAVLGELALRAPLFGTGGVTDEKTDDPRIGDRRRLVSVYFGGGTPSLWDPSCVARALAAVRKTFAATDSNHRSNGVSNSDTHSGADARENPRTKSAADPRSDSSLHAGDGTGTAPLEVTLEANPDDLPRAVLDGLHAAGINRLSIGAQSFSPERLTVLGRLHGPDETRRAVADARAAGFGNLSLDLIYGLPAQGLPALARDLDALLALDADHLSIYQLTVEPRTAFFAYQKSGAICVPENELLADMAELVEARVAAAGYRRYEISSYARPGKQSRHNSLYWSGGEWLGLGSSAHSFRRLPVGGERFSSVKNVDAYLRATVDSAGSPFPRQPLVATHEPLDEDTLCREAMWLGLRMIERGVDRARFRSRFGFDPAARFPDELASLQRDGLVELSDERVRLTARGALLADEVGMKFL